MKSASVDCSQNKFFKYLPQWISTDRFRFQDQIVEFFDLV